jgi:hypothetical protein
MRRQVSAQETVTDEAKHRSSQPRGRVERVRDYYVQLSDQHPSLWPGRCRVNPSSFTVAHSEPEPIRLSSECRLLRNHEPLRPPMLRIVVISLPKKSRLPQTILIAL